MSQQLINLNSDLKKLRDEGYDVNIFDGHICVRQIPYLNAKSEIKYGILLSKFNIAGEVIQTKPIDHTMLFSGEFPCDKKHAQILGLKNSDQNITLPCGIQVAFMFSNKPQGGFSNFYDKFISYIRIIAAPAISLDSSIVANPSLPIEQDQSESVFKFLDTNSSRAGIENINTKLQNQKIAIIGLGGTGAYVIDLIAKSCVQEIALFDGDELLNHNAFRAPGAVSIEDLKLKPKKVDYYQNLYSKLRHNINAHDLFIDDENMHLLLNFDYVFLCLDDNKMRYKIALFLRSKQIPFCDVGLGVYEVEGALVGSIRVTSASDAKNNHLEARLPKTNEKDANEYSTNIQIAELNCLNATIAVMQWKKHVGFYQDLSAAHSIAYSINDSNLIASDYET